MPIAMRIAAAAALAAVVSLGCTAHADQTTDKLKSTLQARMTAAASESSISESSKCSSVAYWW